MHTHEHTMAEPTLPLPFAAAPRPPQTRRLGGRYEMQRLIGSGGMALVYEALDTGTGQLVAIKVLRQAAHSHVARLSAEAEALRSVQHPNVVRLLDAGVDGQVPYLVMERAASCLARVLHERGPLSTASVASDAVQILGGLAAVHAQGIVHRDLKPGNLLLACDGRVMLADFGIARVPGMRLDGPGAVVGSPSFMAPEQLRGEHVGPRADLYALGCTLTVLATGGPALEAVSGPLRPVLELARQPEPQLRYATARTMARALAPLAPASLWTRQPHLAQWLAAA
jgi:serine/threonine protein kinase